MPPKGYNPCTGAPRGAVQLALKLNRKNDVRVILVTLLHTLGDVRGPGPIQPPTPLPSRFTDIPGLCSSRLLQMSPDVLDSIYRGDVTFDFKAHHCQYFAIFNRHFVLHFAPHSLDVLRPGLSLSSFFCSRTMRSSSALYKPDYTHSAPTHIRPDIHPFDQSSPPPQTDCSCWFRSSQWRNGSGLSSTAATGSGESLPNLNFWKLFSIFLFPPSN